MYYIQHMHHFQSLDHTGNDWLDDVNSELSRGSRGTEGVHIGTQGPGEDAVVHAMRTALRRMIMKKRAAAAAAEEGLPTAAQLCSGENRARG